MRCVTGSEKLKQKRRPLGGVLFVFLGGSLVFEPRDFVFQPEFLALQFGDFFIGSCGMGECVRQRCFQGLMFGHKFSEVRLKAHAFLLSGLNQRRYDDMKLGACRTPGKGIVEESGNKYFRLREPGAMALDTLQEVQLRAKLQSLLQQHRDLDVAIQSLVDSGTGDQLQVRRLKKMKLDLKDKITHIENMLIPDIIA